MMEIFVETHQRIKDCKYEMIIVVFRRLLLLSRIIAFTFNNS